MKSVQTACSTIDIKTTKCKYCELKSKSQEELTRITKKHEIIKRRDMGRGDTPEECLSEWFEIHSDKVKVKVWGDKLKRLAEKLSKPGGEEKLRIKIEKYLKQLPEQLSDGDDERTEFRKQLPNDIIRRLKKLYMNPPESNISVYRMNLSKYCSRYKIENFRKAVFNWTKSLNIKKRDYLGRILRKEDIFKFVADKLEPLVLARPPSDAEYEIALKSDIAQIVDELPLELSSHSKEFYLNKITENLVKDILNVENKYPSTYIQPTTKEIKEFVRDEVTFFLEKSRVAISTKRMEYLEAELIDILLDLTDIADIDNYVVDDVTALFKELGKLPEYKAKYFANLLLKDYKEFFFRESFFQLKGNSDHGRPDVYSAFQKASGMTDLRDDVYTQRLTDEINKWITKLKIPNEDHNFIESVVKDLASDIVDRHKYILLNPNTKGTEADELEHLKFQIFKWTNKLLGEGNTIALEHAQELMNAINNIPKPSLQSSSVVGESTSLDIDKKSDKSYIDTIIDEINDWYRELSTNIHKTQDSKLNRQVMKELAQDIEKGLNSNEDGIINREVDKWAQKVFNVKIIDHDIDKLKARINHAIENKGNNPKHEKVLIRSYEDIVDEWIDTVPIAPKKEGLFINIKNELVHEIAVKICKIKTKIDHLPPEVIEMKLQEELSQWLKKLPLHAKVDKPNYRERYAEKLVKNIQTFNIHDSTRQYLKVTNDRSRLVQLEDIVLGWLKKLPLYRIKATNEKIHLEAIMKELANKINKSIGDENAGLEEDIIEHIRMLDRRKNDGFVQNMATQLKFVLQKHNLLTDLSQHDNKDEIVTGKIEAWINNLPLNVSDVNRFKTKKNDFINSLSHLISSGSDNSVLKKEILVFMRTIPMIRNHKEDWTFLNEEAHKLIQNLTTVPAGDMPRETQNKINEIICYGIKKWADTLPLKSVHCPRELRSFIADMSSVITTLLIDLDQNITDEKSNDARLHREIVKFLRRFPLRQERSTDGQISRMAEELVKTLKEIRLLRENDCNKLNNVTVGVALGNTSKTDNDSKIQTVKDSDIQENVDTYTRKLVQQISEWFDTLNMPAVHKEGYKEVVINDLAGDIVDRHKYIELNPNITFRSEDELEHLKYQIFKWINKLVGEDNLETIAHADNLMRRINEVPVPMLVRPQDRNQADLTPHVQGKNSSPSPSGSIKRMDTRQQDSNPWTINSLGSIGGKFNESVPSPQVSARNGSNPADLSLDNQSSCCSENPPPPPPPSEEDTKEAVYEKYQKIFRAKCDALPVDSSTPDNAKLAELAKTAIYNGIVKTFFNLKSDPDIENDYGYFEFMLEEKIDELLDVLPQTEELVKRRHAWKLEVLSNAIDMLDQLHSLSDRPSFRQRVRNKFNRKFAKDLELEQCFLLQQGFLAEVADAYILETNYKEKDPLRASAYKNRLMKKVDDLANHLAKEHNVGFRFFKKAQLARIAMKVLEQVPIPQEEVLQEEAEEIQLADEVEKWYNGLPTKPLVNDTDGILRKRMVDLLAKKLYVMHKRLKDQDPSKEGKMKHEMSQFLEKRAQLQGNQDLNINFMVDELHNRLKNRWLKEPIDYEEFEKYKPLSSTFAQVDNTDFLSPLMDVATSTSPAQKPGVQPPASPGTRVDQGYFTPSGPLTQSQAHTSQRSSLYGEDGSIKTMRPSIAPLSIKGETQTYAENVSTGNQMTNTPYVSQQEAMVHSMDPKVPKNAGRISQVGPNEGFASQQRASMQVQDSVANKNINVPLEASQCVPKPCQSPRRSNTPYLIGPPNGSPGQVYLAEQNAQMMQSMMSSPNNGRGAPTSQMASPRMQNVNQSLGQNLLTSRAGFPEQGFDQNMPGQAHMPPGQLYVPSYQGSQGASPSQFPGYLGSRGPTPSHGAGTTAAVGPGPSIDMLESGYHVKCRCLEAYRRRRRLFDKEGRTDRYRPYDCNNNY